MSLTVMASSDSDSDSIADPQPDIFPLELHQREKSAQLYAAQRPITRNSTRTGHESIRFVTVLDRVVDIT